MVHTAKQTVNANVLFVSARVCCPDVTFSRLIALSYTSKCIPGKTTFIE